MATRIFHVPGQEYYDESIIRPEFAEQWFCSESEARSAGWRKSKS
ncbi:sunset domain-containing protein [Aminobacter ciceronei]